MAKNYRREKIEKVLATLKFRKVYFRGSSIDFAKQYDETKQEMYKELSREHCGKAKAYEEMILLIEEEFDFYVPGESIES